MYQQKTWTCGICASAFMSNWKYRQHRYAEHHISYKKKKKKPPDVQEENIPILGKAAMTTAPAAHSCKLCDRDFRSEHALRMHCSKAHGGYYKAKEKLQRQDEAPECNGHHKKYTCTQCGQEFTSRFGFSAHSKVHQHEIKQKHFACRHCGRRYASRTGCYKHQKIKHPQQEQQPEAAAVPSPVVSASPQTPAGRECLLRFCPCCGQDIHLVRKAVPRLLFCPLCGLHLEALVIALTTLEEIRADTPR